MHDLAKSFKAAIYEQFALLGQSLSSGPRLELLDLLCQGPRTVERLAREAGQSVANTSHHLRVLLRARLLSAEKRGVSVTYRLADDEVCAFFQALRRLAESRMLEIQQVTRQFLEGREAMVPTDREALISRMKSGEVTVLDVRPPEEYQAGHIPGALSVPLPDLEQRLSELPREREIVAYCRGPYCVLAIEAVELLRSRGFHAVRLEESLFDWRARGLQVAHGALP